MADPVAGGTGRRPTARWLLVALAGLGAVALYYVAWARTYGLDLRVYRGGIGTWVAGGDPYLPAYTVHGLLYTYPPLSLVVLWPLSIGPFALAQPAEWLASLAALALVVTRSWTAAGGRAPGRTVLLGASLAWACAALLVVEPARSAFDYGQVDVYVMAAVVVDVLVVPRRHRGWLVGLAAAVKLTPLVFLLLFAIERDWRAVLRAVSVLAGTVLLFAAAWPGTSHQYWFHALWTVRRIGSPSFTGNQSWYAMLSRAGLGGGLLRAAWLACAAVTIAVVAAICTRLVGSGERYWAMACVALGTLLVSPISWTHEWVWVVSLPPALLATRRRGTGGAEPRWLLWGLVAIAVLAPYDWASAGAPDQLAAGVLPVWAGATLAVWAVRCWRAERPLPPLPAGSMAAGATTVPTLPEAGAGGP